jgi:hypothetical protein
MPSELTHGHPRKLPNAVGGFRTSGDVGVRYGGQDPENKPGSFATVWCLACGDWEDLRLRGDVFLCRDQWKCQGRVRGRGEIETGGTRRRRRTAA